MEKFIELLNKYNQQLVYEHFQKTPTNFTNNEVTIIETCLQKLEEIKKEKNKNSERNIKEPNKIDLINSIYECKSPPENGCLFIDMHKKETVQNELANIGFQIIKNNKTAVLFLAGGLGSRMDLEEPKGLIQITPLLKKTFFQFFVEQIQFLESYVSSRNFIDSSIEKDKEGCSTNKSILNNSKEGEKEVYRSNIYIYIMTSNRTHERTVTYFEENNYWGIKKENVVFFKQGDFFSTDFDYNILLSDEKKLLMNPSGNGDLFRAMDENNIIEDMKKKKIKYIHVLSIDNILSKVADPVFIGFCSFFNCDIANKCVKKNQGESMGVFCIINEDLEKENEKENQKKQETYYYNTFSVCEYTELPSSILKNPNLCEYGNICHHVFSYDFIASVIKNKWYKKMKIHKIQKKKNYYDIHIKEKKKNVNEVNAYCYEYFIFDVFKFAKRILSFEVSREAEFYPIKSNTNGDCILEARRHLSNLHKTWLLKKNCQFVTNLSKKEGNEKDEGDDNKQDSIKEVDTFCEISPLVSYNGIYSTHLPKNKNIVLPYVLEK